MPAYPDVIPMIAYEDGPAALGPGLVVNVLFKDHWGRPRPREVVDRHLTAIGEAARGSVNLLPVLKAALADYVTIGECCDVLRQAFGEYRPTEAA